MGFECFGYKKDKLYIVAIQKAFFPCYFYLDFVCLQLLNNQLLQKQTTKNSWNGVKLGLQNLLEWCNFVGV